MTHVWIVYLDTDDGTYVSGVFRHESDARAYAESVDSTNRKEHRCDVESARVEQETVLESVPEPRSYWHCGAAVYPDGTYDEWVNEHVAVGRCGIPPVDDHLNQLMEPWDGHMQGHCGEHVSVVGTDQPAVMAAFQRHLAAALSRQTGVCPDECHHAPADGRTVFDAGFLQYRRARARETVDA